MARNSATVAKTRYRTASCVSPSAGSANVSPATAAATRSTAEPAVIPTAFVTTGFSGPIRFETITDSDAQRTATIRSAYDCQRYSPVPDWKKISVVPPSATRAPARARTVRRSRPWPTASSRVSRGPTAITTAPIPAGTSWSAQ